MFGRAFGQALGLLLTLASATPAADAHAEAAVNNFASNPLVGVWAWNAVGGACPEIHEYRADGSAITQSGDEVLEKSYEVSRVSDGLYRITLKSLRSNGKKDCTGHTTKVGGTNVVFVQFQNFGGYLTCASESGMSCYGSAVRAPTTKLGSEDFGSGHLRAKKREPSSSSLGRPTGTVFVHSGPRLARAASPADTRLA
jgi:hypothetical protein